MGELKYECKYKDLIGGIFALHNLHSATPLPSLPLEFLNESDRFISIKQDLAAFLCRVAA